MMQRRFFIMSSFWYAFFLNVCVTDPLQFKRDLSFALYDIILKSILEISAKLDMMLNTSM